MAPLSLYQITIPTFIKNLKTLSTLLQKGQAKFAGDESKLLQSRLVEDMQPLTYQIQRVSDTVKGVAVRVGKATPEAWEDNETTFPELEARIQKTIAFLEKLSPDSMDGMEDQEITMKTGGGERKMSASDYITGFALPNFYFHFVTSYALLRKEGVEIGKLDYLGAR